MIDIEYEQYDFKKAMQENVNKKFAVLLKDNGFVKYKKNKFAREKDQIVQLISFSIEKDRMKVFAMFIPVYINEDSCLEYGIEVTGSNGYRLLNGKYFTTVYEPEKFNKEIQYRNYCEKHKLSLQKIYSAIEEGIIPEMDEVDSLEKFIVLLEEQNACFFSNPFWPELKKNITYQYVMGVYKCISNDFAGGMNMLKQVQAIDCIWWEILKRYETESVDEFMKEYNENCDEMRRYYKLL